MGLAALAVGAAERTPLPDAVLRAGIDRLVRLADRRLAKDPHAQDGAFAAAMADRPIAENTAEANDQHYELPAAFFAHVLGPHLKYSSGFYARPEDGLAEAEAEALRLTCEHAGLADGQRILELGCGWGSLSLWMAEAYPGARILSVSNSRSQRAWILARAAERGLANLDVVTCDMNAFVPPDCFDRVVSVEMFEHMANWRGLLERLRPALRPDGRLFLHVFSHASRPYRFDASDSDDFIARYFFTGGIMPSHTLAAQFPDLFEVEETWRWSGTHYRRTADDWLANFDRNRGVILELFREVYGPAAPLWMRRWRLFFLAVSGLFGVEDGRIWGVSHHRLRPAP